MNDRKYQQTATKACNFYLISFYFYHYYLGKAKINTLYISYYNKNHEKDTFFGKQYATPDRQNTTKKPCESRFFGFVTRKRKGKRRKFKTGSKKSAMPGEFFCPKIRIGDFLICRFESMPILESFFDWLNKLTKILKSL
jgi:hypothetical protein